jgi:hypothetical protein
VLTPVAVEKVPFSRKSENLGDRKCLGKLRKSFVGLPSAKFFQPFSGEGVFQQPRLFSTVISKSVGFGRKLAEMKKSNLTFAALVRSA